MFAVIFEVNPKPERFDDYLHHAGVLRPELQAIEGFILNERYRSLTRPGWLVSLSIWWDEKALIRWRTHALHHEIQAEGRAAIFADYHLRVGEIVASDRPGQRFDATEVSADKAVSVTACPVDEPPAFAGEGFDSITDPGKGLFLRSWPDTEAASTAVAGAPGQHRVVRVIRDYGMFRRAEAPRHFAV
jgi:heme-degrading monooxygenase HmoA